MVTRRCAGLSGDSALGEEASGTLPGEGLIAEGGGLALLRMGMEQQKR